VVVLLVSPELQTQEAVAVERHLAQEALELLWLDTPEQFSFTLVEQ
jgi:hypothetical protein